MYSIVAVQAKHLAVLGGACAVRLLAGGGQLGWEWGEGTGQGKVVVVVAAAVDGRAAP